MIWLTLLLAGCPVADDEQEVETAPWTSLDEAAPFWVGARAETVVGVTDVVLPTVITFPTESSDGPLFTYFAGTENAAQDGASPYCDTPRPVILFSHGNGGVNAQSHFLTEFLAARGYIVVAPNHTGNTVLDLGDVPVGEMAVRRPDDIRDAFDFLLTLNADSDDPLFGCVDPNAGYAVTGHSFGGYTSLAIAGANLDLPVLQASCPSDSIWLCGAEEVYAERFPNETSGDLSDSRVWATAPLAPAGRYTLGAGLANITVPTLVVGGLGDITTPWSTVVRPIYEALTTEPRYLVGMDRVGHYTFTNFCLAANDGCGSNDLPLAEAHLLMAQLVTAFFDVSRGEERSAPWLPPTHDVIEFEVVSPPN